MLSALKPRCIACSNCVLACPFGIPKIVPEYEQMMKCDMCYDRTSADKRPMCATVCPSGALAYAQPGEIARTRCGQPVNTVRFGAELVRTKVLLIAPAGRDEIAIDIKPDRLPAVDHSQQPLWREEFSVLEADERYVSRRQA